MSPSNGRVRCLRVLGAVVVVVVVAGAAAAAVALTRGGGTGGHGHSTTTTSPPTTTTAPARVTPIGTYSVATTSLTVTVPGVPPTDGQLPTTVWYPSAVVKPATGGGGRHRYPLLVFSQGFDQAVSSYSALIVDWASAGFVVAGPTYPHTAPQTSATLDRTPSELDRHPADLRAVITSLVQAGRAPGSVLSGKIDASEIGLVGHSDGGDVSLALAANSCCRDTGVKAVATLSGAEYRYFGGQYFPPGTPTTPLLVVQGDNDPTYNPPVCSAELYDAAPGTKYYLDLLGATHLDPYEDATTWEAVVAKVTTDFFDAELSGERRALTEMAGSGNVPNVAQLAAGGTAPPATGTCPTAPATPGTTPPATTTTTTTSAPVPATTTTTTTAVPTTTTTAGTPAPTAAARTTGTPGSGGAPGA
ncbi:MAG TPA: hypothetical protein VND62_03440 [Acidimicrobiales bacterium]|nr:hypothetical protein [Acidimicrobiales bacterium]